MINQPSTVNFEFFKSLENKDFDTILRKDQLQPRNDVESAIIRDAVARHALTLKNMQLSLAKDLNKFTNQLMNSINGIRLSKKFAG